MDESEETPPDEEHLSVEQQLEESLGEYPGLFSAILSWAKQLHEDPMQFCIHSIKMRGRLVDSGMNYRSTLILKTPGRDDHPIRVRFL